MRGLVALMEVLKIVREMRWKGGKERKMEGEEETTGGLQNITESGIRGSNINSVDI